MQIVKRFDRLPIMECGSPLWAGASISIFMSLASLGSRLSQALLLGHRRHVGGLEVFYSSVLVKVPGG